ncbi:MAG: filamentous hemagglutinin N-terminal domain-containing protein, partial [Burkholderiales bacterium]|nr:filamentous hemagglutinin N-terminal domain-containing protein [Burkholderiales bacterium]
MGSTNAARRNKGSLREFAFRPCALGLALASAFSWPAGAQVLPSGASVVSGSAAIQQNGARLTVTNSPGAIINWQSFSIGAGATAQFVQQGASSSVFNRVTGSDPSAILGNLVSNGKVFLINPNGITVGAGARIDAAAFVASSLGISNADLLAGRFRFEATPGSANVVNHGTIVTQDGGFVYFVGRNVENSGIIHTPRGEIILAAGNAVEIINPRSPDLRVEIAAGANEAVNLGRLVASGGTIGMFGGSVRQRGVASANTAEVDARGRIVFRARRDVDLAAGSRTEASGPAGGTVTIQAETGTASVAGVVEARGVATPIVESPPQPVQIAATTPLVSAAPLPLQPAADA